MSERADYIGMPHMPKLDRFGEIVYQAFTARAYVVGSALTRRDWRDVDVRVILDDDRFELLFGAETDWRKNPRLAAVATAFAALANQMTGLPVDFGIDQMTEANADENASRRHPLGVQHGVIREREEWERRYHDLVSRHPHQDVECGCIAEYLGEMAHTALTAPDSERETGE